MKKKSALLLCLALAASLALTACTTNLPLSYRIFPKGGDGTGVETPETVSGGLKLGLAVGSDAEGSVDGRVVVNSYAVAVLTDQNGVITDVSLDKLVTTVDVGADGKLVQDKSSATYASVRAGGGDADWVTMAAALEDYAVGKTAAEARGMDGGLVGAQYPELIAKAVESARNRGAMEGDAVGVGLFGNLDNSMDAKSGREGTAVAYNSYGAASFGADGRITSCYFDGSDAGVKFDETGKLTAGAVINEDPFETKIEKGDAYHLAAVSAIGREYYQQALEYAAYATGKTVDEVTGIAVTDHGSPDGVADLAASVSISVKEFNEALKGAAANAG